MFRDIRKKSVNKTPARAYGVVFADHLAGLDPKGPLYKSVKQAVDLCDSALRNVRGRISLSDKLFECEGKIRELSYINRMSDGEFEHFKSLLERFSALSHERMGLLDRMATFNKSLPALASVENQAGGAVSGMREAEEYRRALRHDISALEGEKEDLSFEHRYLSAGIGFISRFGVGLTGMLVFAAALLWYMSAAHEADVVTYGAALAFLSVTAATLIYIFRKRISLELEVNNRKRQKAVHILNQKNTVFAFYSNFLNYSYGKYHVRSASMLQSNLNDYGRYKQVASRIDNVRSVMYQTQREIELIMRDKGIDQDNASIEGFARSADLDGQKRALGLIMAAKAEGERQIAELENRHTDIWNLLTRLKADRPAARERIEGVIQTYLGELGRILEEGATA